MGKSLIIKGADFSANGIKVLVLAGSVTYTNTQENALNSRILLTWLETLGLNNGEVTMYVHSNDSTVNSQLSGKIIRVLERGLNTEIGTFVWGEKFKFTYPLSEGANGIIVQCGGVTWSGEHDIIFDIYKN